MKRVRNGAILCAIVLAVAAALWVVRISREAVSVIGPARTEGGGLILDAGHGGEDGGAVSYSGAAESNVNLQIVLRLDQIMGFYGVAPVLTRDGDYAIYSEGMDTLRKKKVSDIRNRVALIEGYPQATLISIHQNSYQDPKYTGAQVFYAPTESSRPFAEYLQKCLAAGLEPDNQRVATKIPSSVYLMNHISCRAVLVECGFLSNPSEDQLLQSETYQKKLAAVIAAAYFTYEPENQVGEESLYEG